MKTLPKIEATEKCMDFYHNLSKIKNWKISMTYREKEDYIKLVGEKAAKKGLTKEANKWVKEMSKFIAEGGFVDGKDLFDA